MIAGLEEISAGDIGIRPENVIEASEEGRGETLAFRGTVEFVEPIGHQVIVHLKIDDDLLVAALESHQLPKPGDTLDLKIELDAIHLFDAEKETRLTA